MTSPASRRYDESKIQTLSALEHIQARPGMYIGRLGTGEDPDDGIYILAKEVVDNSIDEFMMGFGKKIEVSLDEAGSVTVRDYGRGIPLGKLVECVSVINTGGKYNSEVFQYSVGLNGVGLKAVNALSESFCATAIREGHFRRVQFENGILAKDEEGATKDPDGTEVTFRPSEEHFPGFSFKDKYIRRRLVAYAHLNSGLTLLFNGEKFFSRNGLRDLLGEKLDGDGLYEIVHHKAEMLEFAFCHTSGYSQTYHSFVNGQHTNDGGTHESAFREGVLKGVNQYAGTNLNGDDVRNGLVGTVAIKLQAPIFESQTKNKLGNTEIRGALVNQVRDAVSAFLYKNTNIADAIIAKVERNEKLRKEIQTVKKQASEREKKTRLRIPKLRDCKYHLDDRRLKNSPFRGEETMIFLTEGQSAAGSIISCRDVDTQAIFSLRGKPLNCHGHRQETVYRNEELYYIMQALGIEDDIEGLRYEKIIIATDADVDGAHIRNLLVTYFLTFFEQLVISGHLYILETPLFRVRNKKRTIYCYNEAERDEAMKTLGAGHEVTRFKGLGEISPSEFGQFIGEDMRCERVNVDHQGNVLRLLEFFMGRNTPLRRSYIMDNLV